MAKPHMSLGTLIIGIATALAGVVLLSWPGVTLVVFSQLAGWAMGAAGFLGAIEEARASERRNLTIVRYVAIGLTGVVLLVWPGETILVVTVLAGVWLVVDGGSRVLGSMWAASARSEVIGNVFGLVELLLGVWVMARPVGGLRASAVVVGIGLIVHGLARMWDAFADGEPEPAPA